METKTLEEVTDAMGHEGNEKKETKSKKAKETNEDKITPMEPTASVTEDEPDIQDGIYVHKFKKPFEDCGEVYEKIEFNFEALTGKDMIDIENEMKLKGIFGEMAELSKTYQCHVAVRAAAKSKTMITVDALERLPMKDFFKITNQVRDFLIATGG